MKTQASIVASFGLALGMVATSPAAETGDIDGDGRLSIADLIRMQDGSVDLPLDPAPGSFDAINGWCGGFPNLTGRVLVYAEALRRAVPGSLPHWLPLGERWAENVTQPPLEVDSRVQIRFEPMTAPGGSNDKAEVRFRIDVFEAVRAFSIVLEAEGGILRVPFSFHDECGDPRNCWNMRAWYQGLHEYHCHRHNEGDLSVAVTPAAHLITAGRYVVTRSGIPGDPREPGAEVVMPGSYSIVTEARLPRGTKAGRYGVKVLPASEVLLGDAALGERGTLLSPEVEGDGEIVVENDLTAGFDGGVPPLRFEPADRKIVGNVELRVVGVDGAAGTAEEPVASSLPGDKIKLRVQLRTEVPLNEIHFRLVWPRWALLCSDSASHAPFVNPEDGQPYWPFPDGEVSNPPSATLCSEATGTGCIFRLAGAWSCLEGEVNGSANPPTNYRERLLEYFKPLGEWIDVHEVEVILPPQAKGGSDIPIGFQRYNPGRVFQPGQKLGGPMGGQFIPYTNDWPCTSDKADWPESTLWSYQVSYEDTFIHVLGGNEPPPPPNHGIRFELIDAAGAPGELVEVPIFASSETSLGFLRLVVEYDPDVIFVEAVEVDVTSDATGDVNPIVVPRGGVGTLRECVDEDFDGIPDKPCTGGIPYYTTLYPDSDERFARLDWLTFGPNTPHQVYLRPEPQQIARLLVRIKDDPPIGQSVLRPGRMTILENGFEVEALSGGSFGIWPAPELFSPAEVSPGLITVNGFIERDLLRGDSSSDGRVDLSDAITTLGYLFLGNSSPVCLDAVDADDSGLVEISDAIYLLGALFLGTNTIPPPFPSCGPDPTAADDLGCAQACK